MPKNIDDCISVFANQRVKRQRKYQAVQKFPWHFIFSLAVQVQLLKSSAKMSHNHNIFPMWAYRVEMKEWMVSGHWLKEKKKSLSISLQNKSPIPLYSLFFLITSNGVAGLNLGRVRDYFFSFTIQTITGLFAYSANCTLCKSAYFPASSRAHAHALAQMLSGAN